MLARPNSVVDDDEIDFSTEAFQWLRDGARISGAIREQYVLTESDRCREISLAWSYMDRGGTQETVISDSERVIPADYVDPSDRDSQVDPNVFKNPGDLVDGNSRPTGDLVFLGDAAVGETVIARPNGVFDSDGIVRNGARFQWFRNAQAIPGATNQIYVVQAADDQTELRVQWIYTDGGGTEEVVTSPFKWVTDENLFHPCDLRP